MKIRKSLLLAATILLAGNVVKAEDEFSEDLLGGKGNFEEWRVESLSSTEGEGPYLRQNKQAGWKLSQDGSDTDKCVIPQIFAQFCEGPGIIQRSAEGEGKDSKYSLVLMGSMYFGSERTPVKDGEEYQIQFYVKGDAGANVCVYAAVYGDNKPSASISSREGAPAGNDQWVLVTERIKIVGQGAQFAFYRIQSNKQVQVDNLEIRRVINQ